ncbi:MAG: dGTP triphosphohydrolase [Phycisphaerae bacterium]
MTGPPPSRGRLAPYAVWDNASRGRVHPRADLPDDHPFDLDRYRILTCMAFRRLMHKTQVFVTDEGDHFRTRLTHTLEVVAQAERLAKLLHLNVALAGAIALAHDLGHAPFGHAGEKTLAELMRDHGGFEHNVQSLRVVDYLEHPYPAFRGLNLSFEVRESLIKHRTRFDRPGETEPSDPSVGDLLATGPNCPLEGQAANLADAIAYTLHDIEDGLGRDMLTEELLSKSRIWREAAAPVRRSEPTKPIRALRRPIIDRIAARMVDDAARTGARRIQDQGVTSVDSVRQQPEDLLAFSPSMQEAVEELQGILLASVYRNRRVIRMDAKARRLIRDLFEAYLAEPELMPGRFTDRISEQGLHRVVCDYVGGMTDRFCQQEHRRLFAPFHFE